MILGAMALYTTAISADAEAADATLDIVAGNENVTVDAIVSGEIAPRTTLLLRGTTDIDYDKTPTMMFGSADLKPNIWRDLYLVFEGQVTDYAGVDPRIGLETFFATDDLFLFSLNTVGYVGGVNAEALFLAQYTPAISEKVDLFAQGENITRVGTEGHEFSLQRLRLGVDVNGYALGAAANLTEAGGVSYNVGGFISTTF